MHKALCLLLASFGLTMTAEAHLSFKLANELALEKLAMSQASNTLSAPYQQRWVNVIIDFDSKESFDRAVEAGVNVTHRIGNHAFASIPLSRVEEINAMEGVKRIDLSRTRRLLNHTSRKVSFVNEAHTGAELPQTYTGEGVLVALYDLGLDPNHINFIDSLGDRRVKKLWCFPRYAGWEEDIESGKQLPPEKDVNIYSTPESIASFTTDDRSESHGTHVLGTAAGSYVISKAKDYRGMAPAAELAVACGRLDDYSILRGVDSISHYADSLGIPCTINISLGSNNGPHDGTDMFTAMINEIAGRENTTICVAAGNEGDEDIAVVKELTETDSLVRTVILGKWNSDNIAGSFEVWSNDSTAFDVYLDIVNPGQPNGEPFVSLKLKDGKSNFISTNDMSNKFSGDSALVADFSSCCRKSRIGGTMGLNPDNNRYGAEINADFTPKVSNRNLLLRVVGKPGQKIFVYSPSSDKVVFSSKGRSAYDKPDGNGSINTIACAPNVIAVGAYSGTNGRLAYFTSWSDMYDGTTLPHIAAPGVDVLSSMSTPYYAAGHSYESKAVAKVDGKAYHYCTMSGTSMATPAMTGITALWLSANPLLTSGELRDIAVSTATTPTAKPNDIAWGAGKVNAYEGLKSILGLNAINSVTADGDNNILIGQVGDRVYEVTAPGEADLRVEIYDVQGRLVSRLPSTHDTATIDLSNLQKGVYVVKASTRRATKSFKLY